MMEDPEQPPPEQQPDPLETARRILGQDFDVLMDTSRPLDMSAIRVQVPNAKTKK